MSQPSTLYIELEFVRAESGGDPFSFRFAPQEYLCRSDRGGFESAKLSWDDALLSDLQALQHLVANPLLPQRVGELLRRFVTPLGWSRWESQIQDATRVGRRVVITIRSAAAELYALPWEFLTLKATGQHIGELSEVLLRYEWPETSTVKSRRQDQTDHDRIAFVWSASGGAVPAAEHQQAIAEACQAAHLPFLPERDALAHASCGRLLDLLGRARESSQPISVLHLLCHGGTSAGTFGLLLDAEDSSDPALVVDAARLRQILAPFADMIRLVVLMTCNGGNIGLIGNQLGSVAQTLHRAGIAAVVASRYPLSVSGANRLAQAFYERLLRHQDPIEGALPSARTALAANAREYDWASLQLYARAEDGAESRPLRLQLAQQQHHPERNMSHEQHHPRPESSTFPTPPQKPRLPPAVNWALKVGLGMAGVFATQYLRAPKPIETVLPPQPAAASSTARVDLGVRTPEALVNAAHAPLEVPSDTPPSKVKPGGTPTPAPLPPAIQCGPGMQNASCNQITVSPGASVTINANQRR